MREFLGRSKVFIVIACIGLAVMIGGFVYKNSQNSGGYEYRDKLRSEVFEMKNELELARGAKESYEKTVVYETGGVDLNRKARDDEAALAKINRLLTWEDGTQYNEVRDEFIKWLGEDDPVVTDFLHENYTNIDGSINYVDEHGANSKYVSGVTYVLKVDGDIYEYMATARAVTVVPETSIEGDINYIFRYKTDKEGNITDFRIQNLDRDERAGYWF